jgi:hypothetical protein
MFGSKKQVVEPLGLQGLNRDVGHPGDDRKEDDF